MKYNIEVSVDISQDPSKLNVEPAISPANTKAMCTFSFSARKTQARACLKIKEATNTTNLTLEHLHIPLAMQPAPGEQGIPQSNLRSTGGGELQQ